MHREDPLGVQSEAVDRLGPFPFRHGDDRIGCAHGRWNRRVIEACMAAGYERVYVSDPWINTKMFGIDVIGRFMVRRTTSDAELQKMVRQDRGALWKMKMRSQVRQGIVGLMGDDLYHRLWCKLTGYNEFEAARQQESQY